MQRVRSNPETYLSAAHPIMLVEFLKESGFSEHEVLSHTNINPVTLSDAGNQITFRQYKQLMLNAIELSENPTIGLEFGTRLNYSGEGMLGVGALACNTFAESMQFIKRTSVVLNPGVEWVVTLDDDYLHIDLEEVLQWEEAKSLMVEVAFSLVTSCIRFFDPLVTEHLIYRFKYAAKRAESVYREHLPGALHFGEPINRMSIPMEFCKRPLPYVNPTSIKQAEAILEKQIEELSNEHNAILRPIQQIVTSREGQIPTIEEVAELFHVSSRTLNRRLKSMGTTFKELVSEIRHKMALEYLAMEKYSVDEVADKLGYSDTSNFSKAFKSWTGHTPSQYRNEFLHR